MATGIVYERWNGAGDQLFMVDNLDGKYTTLLENQELKRSMCDRVTGVGSNGIMEFLPPPSPDYFYKIIMHTGLGFCGPVPFCGNGSRCAAAYACTHGIVPREKWARFSFMAADGKHEAMFREDLVGEKHDVTITMRDITEVRRVAENDLFADSGTAHFVKFIETGTLASVRLVEDGRRFAKEQQMLSPEKFILTSWVEHRPDGIYARCYDTGSDGEIYACGSASAAIAAAHTVWEGEADGRKTKVIHWPGGDVQVQLSRQGAGFHDITLQSVVYKECEGIFHDQKAVN